MVEAFCSLSLCYQYCELAGLLCEIVEGKKYFSHGIPCK